MSDGCLRTPVFTVAVAWHTSSPLSPEITPKGRERSPRDPEDCTKSTKLRFHARATHSTCWIAHAAFELPKLELITTRLFSVTGHELFSAYMMMREMPMATEAGRTV